MKMRIATAPCSYGVFELTTGRGLELPSGAELARVMAEAGYAGTELGPPGFFGNGGEVASLLRANGLDLVGSFLPYSFSRRDAFADAISSLDGTLTLLHDAAAGGALPIILLSDAFCEPERLHYAGAIDDHPDAALSQARFDLLVANVQRAAERCRERGFEVSFHYHAGTYVETRREIAAFIDRMDTSLLGLCFDTGHAAFGGTDPLSLLRDYRELVNHVHLKDVDRARLRAVQASGGGLEEAWRQGVFCPLGQGDAEVAASLDELRAARYAGWLVVEQDQVLSSTRRFADSCADAIENMRFLREHLVPTEPDPLDNGGGGELNSPP